MKIKVKHQQVKGNRIYRFARKRIVTDNLSINDNEMIMFETSHETFFIKREFYEKLLSEGKPTPDMFEGIEIKDYRSSDLIIKAGTVKAALRKLRKLGKYFPNNTVFEDLAGYISHGVYFTIKHDKDSYISNQQGIVDKFTKGRNIKKAYINLTGVEYMDKLINTLRDAGYFVHVSYHDDSKSEYYAENDKTKYYCCYVSGLGVKGAFAENNDCTYSSLDGKIAIDIEESFNKYSDCEIIEDIHDKNDFQFILDEIEELKKSYENND